MSRAAIAINPVQIILHQMDKLNRLGDQITDPENACRIAGCIAELGAAVIGKAESAASHSTEDTPDENDIMNFKEASEFLKMGTASLNREIAQDPEFPVYQPGGKGGRKYFSKRQLQIWLEKKYGEPRKEIAPSRPAQGKLWQVQ